MCICAGFISCSENQLESDYPDFSIVDLPPKSINVKGMVTDNSNSAVEGLTINANRCYWGDLGGYCEVLSCKAVTNTDGYYEMHFTVEGEYRNPIVMVCEDSLNRYVQSRYYLIVESEKSVHEMNIKLNQ